MSSSSSQIAVYARIRRNPRFTELVAKHGDKTVLNCEFGPSVSKNPYLAFKFNGGAKGDKLAVTWVDNKGDTRSDEVQIA